MENSSILIVDDDDSLRRVIEFNLQKRGYTTTAAESAEKALKILKSSDFDLLISDMRMPGMEGIQLMEKAREMRPDLPVIFITAFGSIEKAVEAVKLGAYDYITKPFDTDEFLHAIDRAIDHQRLIAENIKLRAELEKQYSFSDIIGNSEAMQQIFSTIKKVADTDATILITGESGTGKELIVRAIHQNSDRSGSSLVTVNCAAIPKELLESELFGHVVGAFTGAIKDKTGKFVAADGGSVFLDEIGDMPLELQAKLLRVLEDRIVEPVGSENTITVDIRVMAATNTDLQARVRDGKFREDLYYRLNVIPIKIPSLKDRPGDIPILIQHFLDKFGGKRPPGIEKKAMDRLMAYRWPGNVRELENLIKRLIILKKSKTIRYSDLPPEILQPGEAARIESDSGKVELSLVESEKKMIIEALERSGWNQSRAAKRLEIQRHVLLYRIKKYNIEPRER